MNPRIVLAAAAFFVAIVSPAQAKGSRTLGVTFLPVGGWAATRVTPGLSTGLSAGLDWDWRREGSWTSMGGHLASSTVFTEATPLRMRWGPPMPTFRPFVGVGASFLLPWLDPADQRTSSVDASLRLGAEVSAGAAVDLGSTLYLSGEGRYQNFSLSADPLSMQRQEIFSAYLGVGFRL